MREYQRSRRQEAKARKHAALELPPVATRNHAAALFKWCGEKLVVPPGHPASGDPFVIPGYGQRFLRDVLRPGVSEGLICLGRRELARSKSTTYSHRCCKYSWFRLLIRQALGRRQVGHRCQRSSGLVGPIRPWVQGWCVLALQGEIHRVETANRSHCRGVRVARPEVQALARIYRGAGRGPHRFPDSRCKQRGRQRLQRCNCRRARPIF